MSAFCHTRNNMRYVLSLAPNDVKKYLSVAVQICMALGITLAVRSLVIAFISEHLMVNCNTAKNTHVVSHYGYA